MAKDYFIVGVTHVDLAWKRGEAEMAEMQEIVILRLLDALERYPAFVYMLEQSTHFRRMARTRPDLVERLKRYVQEGRLEMLGGMASTLETNIPNGESFVRNQAIGMKWVRENWGVEIKTGWLFDTFGINAQVPQILRQFGLKHLMANRFGGAVFHEIFQARGIDGSTVLVVGRESNAAFVRPENTARVFYQNWDGIDRLFENTDALTGDGPYLLIPYTENEYLVSLEPMRIAEQRTAERPGESWRMALPHEYFAALDKVERDWPVVHADLNPEFTATFSQRAIIRIRNRKIENLLLEAEKWAALVRLTDWEAEVEEAWWRLAFIHFHDVFTGSHPTPVFREVLRTLDEVEEIAARLLNRALESFAQTEKSGATGKHLLLANGLPHERHDVVTVPLSDERGGIGRVMDANGENLPFEVRDGNLHFVAAVPPVGITHVVLEPGESREATLETVENAVLENEFLRLECDNEIGIRQLIWKPTGYVLMENVGDFLVAQQDEGSFQIESVVGSELAAAAGKLQVQQYGPSGIGQTLRLSGSFPTLRWAGAGNFLTWELDLTLLTGSPKLDVVLRLNWKGESTRLRLKLPTTLDTSEGIYEIPFGTVRRKPYANRGTARGEWPAHRFVAVEAEGHGIALANTGTAGVEVSGGTLYTSLLRSPKAQYAGMVADDTSAQHGEHEFRFGLIPYAGTWDTAGVAKYAQELNNPIKTRINAGAPVPDSSFLRLDSETVILSVVKKPEDEADELIVRVYETAGRESITTLWVRDAVKARHSDLTEKPFEEISCESGNIRFDIKPFEIKTFRIERRAGIR